MNGNEKRKRHALRSPGKEQIDRSTRGREPTAFAQTLMYFVYPGDPLTRGRGLRFHLRASQFLGQEGAQQMIQLAKGVLLR